MATVLIVEDEKNLQLLTAARLKPFFRTLTADNGRQAMEIIRAETVDAVVSDIMMPVLDGYGLLQTLRGEGYDTPVLLLTAKQAAEDKRLGFLLSADDYLTKPVDYDELVWRLQAVMRRCKINAEQKITVGGTVVDKGTYTVSYLGKTIELPKKEFDVLFRLLSAQGVILTRDQLLSDIWGYDSDSGEDTLKVHVNRLRNKLEDCPDLSIVTVRGIGYRADAKGGK